MALWRQLGNQNVDVQRVRQSIMAQEDINEINHFLGMTPLLFAIDIQNLPVIKLMLKAGADPNLTYENNDIHL